MSGRNPAASPVIRNWRQWALEAWQSAAPGAIQLQPVKDREHARIRLYWATAEQGLYGEARPILVDGKSGAEVYVRPAPLRHAGATNFCATPSYI